MPLRFELAVGERLYVGSGVITNGRTRSTFILEGNLPVLKEKDVIPTGDAATPLERLYVHVQESYLHENPIAPAAYKKLAVQVAAESPEIYRDLTEIDALITTGNLYRALKMLRVLIRASEQTAAT
jgi:flagellar protein FlbT